MSTWRSCPAGGDRLLRCTNVRTVDGKRPAFVHDKNSTFIFPMSMIRLIEVPHGVSDADEGSSAERDDGDPGSVAAPPQPHSTRYEEAEEDLLARIRSI